MSDSSALLEWHRDTLLWVMRPADAPEEVVMVDRRIRVDRLTHWLFPGLTGIFDSDDKVTLVTSVLPFPLVVFNVTKDLIVRPIRWRLWGILIVPALLMMPPLRHFGRWLGLPFLDLALLLVAVLLVLVLDLVLGGIVARLQRDRAFEEAYPRSEAARYEPRINFTVMEGPERAWDQILLDRWNGDFGAGYRQDLGGLALMDGRLLVGEPGALGRAQMVPVPPGVHQTWLAVARMPNDERVSHAFLALRSGVATKAVPVTTADGAPIMIGVDGGLAAFAPSTAADSLAAASGVSVEPDYLIVTAMLEARAAWIRFDVPRSEDVVMAFHSGYGDGTYPLVTLRNDRGEVLAVAIDFQVW